MKRISLLLVLSASLFACKSATSHTNTSTPSNQDTMKAGTTAPIEQVSNQMEPKGTIFKSVDAAVYLQVDMRLEADGSINGMWGWSAKNPEKVYIDVREVTVTQDGGIWFAYFEAKMPKQTEYNDVVVENDKLSIMMKDGNVAKFVRQ